jgi:galactose mutarotase-like enzyme
VSSPIFLNNTSFSYLFDTRLVHEKSGRAISIESTQKGLQYYAGTFLVHVKGRGGAIYSKYSGVCLETQNFTDSVNNQVNKNAPEIIDYAHSII